MSSPILRVVAEIFLQFYKDKYIQHLLETRNRILCTHYVDEILIIYNTTKINAELITSNMNQI